jgi:hypothetical protein
MRISSNCGLRGAVEPAGADLLPGAAQPGFLVAPRGYYPADRR